MSETIASNASPSGTPIPAGPGAIGRFSLNPVVRLLFFMIVSGLLAALAHKLISLPDLKLGELLSERGSNLWLRALRGLLPTVIAYWLMVRLLERRRVTEFSPRKFAAHVPVGWLVGTGVLLLAAAAMAAFGAFSVHGTNPSANLLAPFFVLAVLPGVTEEIVSRGVLLRVVEDGFGTWISLAFSAILFGAGHLGNPNATLWSSAAIAIEAGLLLGMAYVWTRSLWFCAGLHAAWNFTQGVILGIPVSGIAVSGLLESTSQGPELISGGAFGAEASILTVFICVAIAAYFTRRALQAGQVRRPNWRRSTTYLILLVAALPTAYGFLRVVNFLVAIAIAQGAHLKTIPLTTPVIAGTWLMMFFLFALGATPAPAQGRGPREGEAG
jgi:membrane protease YdiL (CAAX protease family)